MKKVFVSSVIKGFESERQTAESAIKSLGLIPVMAEQFVAQPITPRHACLQGVKKSDLFLAIIGERYGEETNSGKSPCEEEYDEAQRLGIPIFVFIKKCKYDEKQEAFKNKVTSYGKGYYVKFYDNIDSLFRYTIESLSQYASTIDISISLSQASSHMQKHFDNLFSMNSFESSISVVVLPSDQRELYYTTIELSKKTVKDMFQEKALFGETAIFSPRKGIDISEKREHLELYQLGLNEKPETILSIHPDGTLAWISSLKIEQRREYSIFDYHVIDEKLLEDKISFFLHYASWFYQYISNNKRPIFNLFTSAALFNEQGMLLGRKPSSQQNSMSISLGYKKIESPLIIPQKPLNISYSRLLDESNNICLEIIHLIIRAYKAEGLYYET